MNSTTAPVAEAAARGRMARWGHAFLDGRHPWGRIYQELAEPLP